MSRYDEYVKSNDKPQDLCKEIDVLKNTINALTVQIDDMKCSLNCKKFHEGYEDGTSCNGCGDCHNCPDWEFY